MTLRVGITGGMGSGKSTVSEIFKTLGIPVYKADDAAKRLMNEDQTVKTALIKYFGEQVYLDGKLNRQYLGEQVFNNKEKLSFLNSVVHPVTISDGQRWMQKQSGAYAIKEAAIIFESGTQRYLDYIIGVYAPVTLRIFRSKKRDNLTQQEVKARINKQMDDAIKMKLCDIVIINDEQQALLPQVLKLHEALLKMSLQPEKI
ncbi:MAG TPA: dephospho-CoA kinase [Chitinophagaceae bacterium]|jgi:dephospho-CoA kinase|nr:dephospho-CoA kinase [Chitinophagaceae bacterium]